MSQKQWVDTLSHLGNVYSPRVMWHFSSYFQKHLKGHLTLDIGEQQHNPCKNWEHASVAQRQVCGLSRLRQILWCSSLYTFCIYIWSARIGLAPRTAVGDEEDQFLLLTCQPRIHFFVIWPWDERNGTRSEGPAQASSGCFPSLNWLF